MANVSAIPTIANRVRTQGCNAISFLSQEAIKAGAVVTINDTGKVQNANSGDTAKTPLGVANTAVTVSNEPITVHTVGTVCYVANLDDSTAIGEGTTLVSTSVDGVVMALAGGADSDEFAIGLALTDIDADGWGLCLVRPYLSTTA